MRIIFVDNLLIERENDRTRYVLQPHLGLISLIAVAENGGHQSLLYDPKLAVARGQLSLDASLYHDIAHEILRLKPDVVGLTSLGCNFICTLKVAIYLKAADASLPILLGGPHATVLDRAIMERFPQFDVLVRNEAELKLLPLLDALPAGRLDDVPGITFRRGNELVVTPGDPYIADLDALPRPAYHSYPIEELNLTTIRVEAGRGCPYNCTFCSTASFFGRKYRLKSPEKLCAELDYLHTTYGLSDFGLTHDLFTVNRTKVIDFCHAVQGRGYTWKCSARTDRVDPELLQLMYQAGCRSIYYGIETGSQRMQKLSQKRLDLAPFASILDATQNLGMTATASFITGYPREELADQQATLDMIGTIFYRQPTPTLNVQLHLLTPEPGTQLIEDFKDQLTYDGHITDFNFPTLEPDDAEIMEHNPDVFMNHHYYRSVLPRARHVFIASTYEALYALGFGVMAHLLTFYERKLSRLMDAMHAWAEAGHRQPPYDQAFVCAFMESNWGSGHYLTSLVRYMLTATSVANTLQKEKTPRRTVQPQNGASLHPDRWYALSRRAAVLQNLHNCPALLNHLATASPTQHVAFPEALLAEQGTYLLFLDGSGDARTIRNFALDPMSAALLEVFATPRPYVDGVRAFQAATGAPEPPASFVVDLLQLRILQPVEAAQTGEAKPAPQPEATYVDAPYSTTPALTVEVGFQS